MIVTEVFFSEWVSKASSRISGDAFVQAKIEHVRSEYETSISH